MDLYQLFYYSTTDPRKRVESIEVWADSLKEAVHAQVFPDNTKLVAAKLKYNIKEGTRH